MWASLLKHRFYAIDNRFLEQVEPHVRASLLEGKELNLPARNKLKAIQSDLTDTEGNLIPFNASVYFDAHDQIVTPSVDVLSGKARANGTPKNVNVIPLRGVMSKEGDFCGYGTKDVISWISQANADPSIDAIVIWGDSPGGAVDGTEALSNAVKDSAKPIVTFVDGTGASAFVWGTVHSKETIINSETTAWYGSIGVLATLINAQEAYKQKGLDVRIVRDSTSPNKARVNGIEPLDDETLASLTEDLDSIKSTFVDAVKAGRGDRLKSQDVFNGTVFNGKKAVKLGLVDKVGTLQDAIDTAAKYASKPSSNTNPNSNSNPKKAEMKITKKSAPQVAAALAVAGEDEIELTAEHVATLEALLGTQGQAVADAQAALTTANASLTTVQASLTDVNTKLTEATTELTTLRDWKEKSKSTAAASEDIVNTDAAKPKVLSAINQEAADRAARMGIKPKTA